MAETYDPLKLENQICFPLYVCAKEVIRRYKPILDELDLTYTQYIAMMALWEDRSLNVRELGERLYLDSGTLTPVLKSLERKGLVNRTRSEEDERIVMITVTGEGMALRKKALAVPARISRCIDLPTEEAEELYRILHHLQAGFSR